MDAPLNETLWIDLLLREVSELDSFAVWLTVSGAPSSMFDVIVGPVTLELYRKAKLLAVTNPSLEKGCSTVGVLAGDESGARRA